MADIDERIAELKGWTYFLYGPPMSEAPAYSTDPALALGLLWEMDGALIPLKAANRWEILPR